MVFLMLPTHFGKEPNKICRKNSSDNNFGRIMGFSGIEWKIRLLPLVSRNLFVKRFLDFQKLFIMAFLGRRFHSHSYLGLYLYIHN